MPAVEKAVHRAIVHGQNQFIRQLVAHEVDDFLDAEHIFLVHIAVLIEDHHDGREGVNTCLSCQLILVTRVDRGEDYAQSLQRIDKLLESWRGTHAGEAPVRVEHDDVNNILALRHDVCVVILCGD